MVFSSPIFLFFFLPVTLFLTWLTHKYRLRNTVLLILSIFFYIFGEGELILLMLGSITVNYFIGRWIGRSKNPTAVTIGIIVNLAILITYKYTGFIIENINLLLASFGLNGVPEIKIKLPVGISFYTFQSMSYLIDVYRRQNEPQKSFVDLALYVCLFPQLIAGPIVRYKDIAEQLKSRFIVPNKFREGLQRFIIGLGKKVIISNPLGSAVDSIFGVDPGNLSSPAAWFGIICYALQLYFDFSGYSDMAIGLGKMLGFDFLENFRFPYKSKSIREFWQRWHISLSNWFRDYLYIPLGGNRVSPRRVYFNLTVVFFLTGLWHGASWNFVVWGMMHGLFMIIERVGFGKILERIPAFLSHAYTLFVVLIAWVFFRSENITLSWQMLGSLFGTNETAELNLYMFYNNEVLFSFLTGLILSFNGFNFVLKKGLIKIYGLTRNRNTVKTIFRNFKSIFLIAIFLYTALVVSAGSYNPFIYFRF